MSDDTYHHRVYSGVIHAAGDASYLLVATGGAAMAALIFATAIAVRRYAILPAWVGWFGFAAGVAAIASIIFFTMLFWLLWVAVASVTLFLQSRSGSVRATGREPLPTS
jgi:fatty acid desaturase